MAQKAERPLEVKNIRLFAGDYAEMEKLFPRLKAGPAIRLIVSNFIERQKKAVAPLNLDLDLDIEEII
jgi:hypothetical protein